MIQLPNDCRCTGKAGDPKKGTSDELSVTPKNWRTKSASINKQWCIHYRFFDPEFSERYPEGKQVKIREGLNKYHTLAERQEAVRAVMAEILDLLKVHCYNPITGTLLEDIPDDADYIIHPDTGLVKALDEGKKRLKRAPSTIADITVTLRAFEKAAKQLRKDGMPLSTVTRRHVKAVLEQMEKNSDRWSPARYNKHRANLRMVFIELVEIEAIEANPMNDIRKQKGHIKQPRKVLTPEQRSAIDEFLRENYYTFWLFVNIFFHASCRETEIMKVQGKDVDLKNQLFYVEVLKGEIYAKEPRIIKDVAVDFWRQAMAFCKESDYVFSKGLKPGPNAISPRQITRRWASHIKGMKKSRGAGKHPDRLLLLDIPVDADFYSLKHSNFDETTEIAGLETAAAQAGHRSTKMGEEVYAVGEKARKQERQKRVSNTFAPKL